MKIATIDNNWAEEWPPEVVVYIKELLDSAVDDLFYDSTFSSYDELFGGDFKLVEELEDCRDLKVIVDETRMDSILNAAGVVDYASFLGDYWVFLNCTNNSGGDTYFIPKKFHTIDTIANTFALTQKDMLCF
jgi:hypothetical protein